MSLGKQEEPQSILASDTSFREDFVMKIFVRPFFLFRWFKKSICQLMAKRCALSTGYLLRGGLPRNSVDRLTDRPEMTSALYRRRKATTLQHFPRNCVKCLNVVSKNSLFPTGLFSHRRRLFAENVGSREVEESYFL